MVFDYVIYEASPHAIDRYCERFPNINRKQAKKQLIERMENGKILLDVNNHRYIRSDDLFIPCSKWIEKGDNVFNAKSVLTWDMVKHRIQRVVDLHNEEG